MQMSYKARESPGESTLNNKPLQMKVDVGLKLDSLR